MRILILGGTGAMGVHVSTLLAQLGHQVAVTSRRYHESGDPNLIYKFGNAKDSDFLSMLLSERWDAIIDFMIWSTAEFQKRVYSFLDTTDQYVFLSSYRVYADSPVIREDSPRLLDVISDSGYLATDEYALAKARCENVLFGSDTNNWTIVRPAITYDGSGRFQLTVLESYTWLWRAMHHVPVPLPNMILDKLTTMTWGGDVAHMIALLVGNPKAMGEVFTVSTKEHLSWREVADIYANEVSLEIVDCSMREFEKAHGEKYQICYDRMFNRIIDNQKILQATGLEQEQLTGMREGLTRELRSYLHSCDGKVSLVGPGRQARFDKLVGGVPSLRYVMQYGINSTIKYSIRRFL